MKKEKTKSMSRLAKCLLACLFACGTAGLGVALALSSVTVEMKGGYNWERIPSASEYNMLKFVYNDTDKTASVSSAEDENGNKIASGAIVIPGYVVCDDESKGTVGARYKVTTIASKAFKISENSSYTEGEGCPITSVKISEGVTTIKDQAFYYCDQLTSVELPSTITSIGSDAVFAKTGLTEIKVTEGNDNTYSGGGNGIYQGTTLVAGCKTTVIKDGTTTIDSTAFFGHKGFTTITIPSSVLNIRRSAFAQTDLTSIELPTSLISIGDYAFNQCKSLKSVNIPDNVREIGTGAFAYSGLTSSIIISGSVVDIGDYAFQGCTSLVNVTINEGCMSIGTGAFKTCTSIEKVYIPASILEIGEYAFYGCTSCEYIYMYDGMGWFAGTTAIDIDLTASVHLTSWYLTGNEDVLDRPDYSNVKWSKVQAASSFTNLVFTYNSSAKTASVAKNTNNKPTGELSLPTYVKYNGTTYSVTSIPNEGFKQTNITSIVLPQKLETIGDDAFVGCTSLTNISIPSSVTSMGDSNPFAGCTGLTSLSIRKNTVYSSANNAIYKGTTLFAGCNGTDQIRTNTTEIGDYAFSGMGITSIEIPESVQSIGKYAFNKCVNLTTVTFNEKILATGTSCQIKTIDSMAFFNCTSLTTIKALGSTDLDNNGDGIAVLPYSLEVIGSQAFCGCTALQYVIIFGNVNEIGYSAFKNTGLVEAYFAESSGWCVYYPIPHVNAGYGAGIPGLSDASVAATNLKSTYAGEMWKRKTS